MDLESKLTNITVVHKGKPVLAVVDSCGWRSTPVPLLSVSESNVLSISKHSNEALKCLTTFDVVYDNTAYVVGSVSDVSPRNVANMVYNAGSYVYNAAVGPSDPTVQPPTSS